MFILSQSFKSKFGFISTTSLAVLTTLLSSPEAYGMDEPIDAHYRFAVQYEKGLGTEVNPEKALHHFTLAADQGHSGAQCKLAICYFKGKGVKYDDEKALYYCRLAVDQGAAEAQYLFATLFVDPNPTQIFMYLRLAAAQGHEKAFNLLRKCAVEVRDPDAQYNWDVLQKNKRWKQR